MGSVYTEKGLSGISFDMVYIKGGIFGMGSEKKSFWQEYPIHQVRLDNFYIGIYPVTQAVWKAVMGTENNPSYFQGDRRPVKSITWHQAQEFMQMLNQRSDKSYRLPTEAEWEYVARGGPLSEGFIYAGSNKLWEVGSYAENSYKETKAVGQKRPNELGLYDMSGNVWKWCQDWFLEEYYEECAKHGIVKNPQDPDESDTRVIRGGSWINNSENCRTIFQHDHFPAVQDNYLGFRLLFSS